MSEVERARLTVRVPEWGDRGPWCLWCELLGERCADHADGLLADRANRRDG